MKRLNRAQGILLFYAFDIILILIFALSFLPMMLNKKNVIESAVLNPKYAETVERIEISVPITVMEQRKEIVLEKHGSIWIGSDGGKNSSYWPCDLQTVENLINIARKTVKMYKKSDRKESWSSLSVDEESARIISFMGKDGTIYSKLYYGVEDGILQRIAVRSDSSDTVLDTENLISTYLTPEVSFWADPFIYPQALTSLDRNTSETFLRRGQLVELDSGNFVPSEEDFTKTFKNENTIILHFSDNGDNTYTVVPEFKIGQNTKNEEYQGLKMVDYKYSISSWTYEKLLEDK